MKRGQSSVEYLFVVALSLMLIIPASFLFINYSQSSEDSVVSAQLNRIGLELTSRAEELYVIGNNSWMTLEVLIPDTVRNITIYNEREIVIDYYIRSGHTQAIFFSNVNITNGVSRCISTSCIVDISAGKNNIRILSRGDYVSIYRP